MCLLFLTLSTLIIFNHGYNANVTFPSILSSGTVYKWKQLEFTFSNKHTTKEAKPNLNLASAELLDVQPHYSDKTTLRTFVTVAKLTDDTPYTLAKVSNKKGANGPVLEPYPSYEAHNNKNGMDCDAITSAIRMMTNDCNQMWVIDSGSVGKRSVCPPQLLLIDLTSNKIIHRYRFFDALYTPNNSFFKNILINVRNPAPKGNCRSTMVYVADVGNHGLVVYDYQKNRAWRIENRFMYPDPNYGLFKVAGMLYESMEGIFGLTTDKKYLYFHPLASVTEYSVPLSMINNSTKLSNKIDDWYKSFRPVFRRRSQCTISVMDSHKNLYCATLSPIQLTLWNADFGYEELIENPLIFQYVNGMKIVRNHNGIEELWILSKFKKKKGMRYIVMRYLLNFDS